MANYTRVKTWTDDENLTNEDLNAEFDNVINNSTPAGMDDYSSNASQMQTQTDPGDQGSESLATSLAGEIERIRYVLSAIIGLTYWYDDPSNDIETLNTSLASIVFTPPNRVVSGKVDSDGQPIHLSADGSGLSATVDSSTDLVYRVGGTAYTIVDSTQITSLTAAPGSNNTCLVNRVEWADQEFTKFMGNFGGTIPIDNAGSEITSRVGQFHAFKVNNGLTDEYFLAFIYSSTLLTNVVRGNFFDSSDAGVPAIAFADNDTITLLQKSYIFARTDLTLDEVNNQPVVSATQPSAPATGDYWLDLSLATPIWKKYNGVTFNDATATLIGMTIQDDTNCIAARSLDAFGAYSELNNIELDYESTTEVRQSQVDGRISVYGNTFEFTPHSIVWDITSDLASGESESSSTVYWCYITKDGDPKISGHAPQPRGDLKGWYHPHKPWRCVGMFFNDGGSDITYAHTLETATGRAHQKSSVESGEAIIDTGSGHGSTDSNIRYLTNTIKDTLKPYVYMETNSTNGVRFFVGMDGVYNMVYGDVGSNFGISLNSTQLTTAVRSITAANRLCHGTSASTEPELMSLNRFFKQGDIVRPHTDASVSNDTEGNYINFRRSGER